jgi:hypothetical protein
VIPFLASFAVLVAVWWVLKPRLSGQHVAYPAPVSAARRQLARLQVACSRYRLQRLLRQFAKGCSAAAPAPENRPATPVPPVP